MISKTYLKYMGELNAYLKRNINNNYHNNRL